MRYRIEFKTRIPQLTSRQDLVMKFAGETDDPGTAADTYMSLRHDIRVNNILLYKDGEPTRVGRVARDALIGLITAPYETRG